MKKFYLEGYGCSLNVSETEQIAFFLENNDFKKVDSFKDADYLIINTCSVKMTTEQRMLSRINLFLSKKKKNAKVIVTGCLASTNTKQIEQISKEITVLDTKLSSLCNFLKIKNTDFSPSAGRNKSNPLISIIPLSVGCMGNCTYCATKIARGNLKSYSIKSINSAFKKALTHSKEIWLTSQDLGCYGFDINTSLPALLKKLLENKGEYRIRLGMMNPNHFNKIKKGLLPLFEDERLYKFLHLPLQSGSDRILKSMNRKYFVKEFLDCLSQIRKIVPDMTISTDVIVGFPGETKKEFQETLNVISVAKPNVVNISRFGKRKGTVAEKMSKQLIESEKKDRSRTMNSFCKELFVKQNKALLGAEFVVLVSEKNKKGFNIARTNAYRPVVVLGGLGSFARVKITSSSSTFFNGELL